MTDQRLIWLISESSDYYNLKQPNIMDHFAYIVYKILIVEEDIWVLQFRPALILTKCYVYREIWKLWFMKVLWSRLEPRKSYTNTRV